MRKLAKLIENELSVQDVCAVYDSDLARIWPKKIGERKRKDAIERFAKAHALNVTFYDVGLCAIFEKPYQANSGTILLPLKPKRAASERKKKANGPARAR